MNYTFKKNSFKLILIRFNFCSKKKTNAVWR